MSRILLSFGILTALSCGLFAQVKTESILGFPVTKQKLVQVLKSKQLDEPEIVATIKTNGVNFQLTPAVERELKTSRATSRVIAAVRQNYRITMVGIANGKATNLVTPTYPPAAKAVRVFGTVNVLVVIDEEGQVIDARAISGHPLLKQSAEKAALASTFIPTTLSKQKVKVTGIIVYNFVE